ncbi:MAG TPA: nitroreductase family protein [Draconibacterium sp.]|nr:nitroreductase family protein [Draconibacterium sp.]
MEAIELTETGVDIHQLIKERWSPRAFSSKKIPEALLKEIFTAASWAASAMNEQPWHYIYAENGTEGFEKLWSCLNPTNQIWTKNVPVIFAAFYHQNYRLNGKPNRAAMHDLGMANAQLLLQATSTGVYGHLMGGFDSGKLTETLETSNDLVPVVMGVLGYPGDPEKLEEPFRSRELKPRTRLSLDEFVEKV